ncbi:ABC-three component system middle component 7 [Caballeronia sp. ATUFL_M1_KS5A]|uniref:ABC-three component system middle component 7 n=1 Tax=Caballeronia sp. ATUFL_M1_KS5A TaxID=2921778 RepID=UPI0032EAB27A
MITPSKFISFEKSILSRLPFLCVDADQISIRDLYALTADHFAAIDEFLYALDVLYILNKINIDFESEIIEYA